MGYVFVKLGEINLGMAYRWPGAVKFVHFSGNHATSREVLDMIKRIVETGVAIETEDQNHLKPGEKVKVNWRAIYAYEIGEVIERGNKDYFMIRNIPGFIRTF